MMCKKKSCMSLVATLAILAAVSVGCGGDNTEIATSPITTTETPTNATSEAMTEFTESTATSVLDEVSATEPQIDDEPLPEESPLRRVRELASQTVNSDGVDNEWDLWLINSYNPIRLGYSPDLTFIGHYSGERRYLDSRAAEYLTLMAEAARIDGITLTYVSTFRGMERQQTNFRNLFYRRINERGYTREQAFADTMSWIAVPGTSEHNAGVAVDFNQITESFENTSSFRWLQENAHEFGFILRYPRDTTEITGVNYEPWHWRFVGLHHAAEIRRQGITLEEYMKDSCAGDDSVVAAFRATLIH
jgi:D-alanyl-D-alanine carboxypeptidase